MKKIMNETKTSIYLPNLFIMISDKQSSEDLENINCTKKNQVDVIVRFDLDFWEWIEEIQWYTYWNAM